MKKTVITILSALLLCSCGDVYRTYETYEIVKQGTDMFVDYIDANGQDWKLAGIDGQPGCYVYQEFRFDEITDDVLQNGAVLVYLVDGAGRDNILPYVFPVENGKDLLMQNIRYDVERGILTLVIEWQDFKVYDQGNYKFKVCILSPGK
ncbi:MAG: hypothetical protein ACSW76_03590 [Bacteroidaceae bacterium]